MAERTNLVVKYVDMTVEMQREVEDISKVAIDRCKNDKEIATFIKDNLRFFYFFNIFLEVNITELGTVS
jgi:hypothetical protein